jgi:3-hydroxyisobutyrate dehydrogenase-like beta-hydroxyacid dehydrogenase
MKLPTMLTGDYLPHFSLKNMLKDANFGLEIADKDGLTLPVLSSAASAMIEQMNAGRGEEDYSVVYENYRNG